MLRGLPNLVRLCGMLAVALVGSSGGCDRSGAATPDGGTSQHRTVEITWMFSTGPDRGLIESQVADFERANPDIHVRMLWTPGGSQYQTKLKTLIAAGQPPDLFWCGDVWIPYLRPFLLDITSLLERDRAEVEVDDFYPTLLQAGRWNGRQYLLPRFFNVSLLYYNRRIFDEARRPYPSADWTWADYVAASQALTVTDAEGRVRQWGSTIITGWWGEWGILLRQSGGSLFDATLTHCLLGTPEARRAMRFYSDKVNVLHMAPAPGRGPANGFASDRYAMHFGGHTGDWPAYKAIESLDWDIQLLPQGPLPHTGGEVAIDAVGISRTTTHPEAAWKLIKFLHSRENILKLAELGDLPVRRSVAEQILRDRPADAKPRHLSLAFDAIAQSAPPPQSPDFIEVTLEVIQPEIDLAIAQGKPMDQCIDAAVAAADTFLATLGQTRAAPTSPP